jgi:hypothetical protein
MRTPLAVTELKNVKLVAVTGYGEESGNRFARAPHKEAPACLEHSPDVPSAVVWNSPVVGLESPDQCGVSVDATGHVAHVHYMSGD